MALGSLTVQGRTERPCTWAAETSGASTWSCHGPMPSAKVAIAPRSCGGGVRSSKSATRGRPRRGVVQAPQGGVVERLHDRPLPDAGAPDLHEQAALPLRSRLLELEQETRGVRVAAEHGGERERPDVRLDVAQGDAGDAAGVAGDAQQRLVVDDDQLIGGGRADVELQDVRTLREREVVGGDGVLGGVSRGASVGDDLLHVAHFRRAGAAPGHRAVNRVEVVRYAASRMRSPRVPK